MAFISLGTIDKNLIPILISCIFSFLSRLLFTYKETVLFTHPLISNLFATAAKYFTVIPFIIIKVRSKKENESFEKKGAFINGKITQRNLNEEISRGKWKFFLLSGVIFFIQGSILFFTIQIKTNLYLLNIVTKNIQNDIVNNWKLILLRLVREIVFSLHDIVNKYAMEKKFCSVYEISFYTGLILTVLFGTFAILDYFFFKLDNYKDYFEKFNTKELLVLIGYIITQLGLYVGALFTNKNNTPCHIFIIYVFGQIALYMDFSINSIAVIICTIFILFISLIFNEIIEFNFCGLSDNTKKNIMLRLNSEDSDIQKNFTIGSNNDILIELNEDKDSEKDINSTE